MSEAIVGKEPDPTQGPVRAFRGNPGFRIMFGSLIELRPAMVKDDVVIVDSLASRKARDEAIRLEFAASGVDPWPDGLARTRVHDIADRRHPYEEGLHGILELVYPEIAGSTSLVQLYDYPIVSAIAARLNKAKQATVFKRDREEGLAPQTQRTNIERAVALADTRYPDDPEFAEQVRSIYEVLVPATVAVQQTMFDRTYLLDDWDAVGFSGVHLAA